MNVKSNKLVKYQVNKTGEFSCTICGAQLNIARFKDGYICNSCLQYVKAHL